MKKLITIILTLCMCFTLGVSLTACDFLFQEPEHTHAYETVWSYDDTCHWYACEDATCSSTSQKSKHIITNGKCETCQYGLVSKGLSFETMEINDTTNGYFRRGYRLTGLGECMDAYVYIPNTFEGLPVFEIGEKAFMDCETLVGVNVPQNVISIETEAFRNCVSLETVNFEEKSKCTYLGLRAFWGCKALKNVDIPSELSYIGGLAFNECYKLERVNYDGTIDKWVTIDFDNDSRGTNPLFYADLYIGEVLIKSVNLTTAPRISNYAFAGSSIEEINISVSVEEIGSYAFQFCNKLTTVTFDADSQCTVIKEGAFYNCDKIENLIIPNSIRIIEGKAFDNCISLKSVSFDENSQCEGIGNNAFSSCRALEEIKLPRMLRSINEGVFINCSSLKRVSFYENSQCKAILKNAFYNCVSLESVYLPKSVHQIEVAFYGCGNLQRLELPFIGKSVGRYKMPFGYIFGTTSYNGAVEVKQNAYDSYQNNFSDTTNTYYIPQSLNTVKVLNEVALYGGDFYNCSMIEKIVLNEGLTTIGDEVFKNCSSLLEVKLSNSINEIGRRAFSGCSSLSKIQIPNDINILQTETFYDCEALTEIELPASIKEIEGNVFKNCKSLQVVHYAGGLDDWVQIAFADEYASGLYFADELYIDNELLSGKITLTTAPIVSAYAFAYYQKITEVEISSAVTNIGECAFLKCAYLETVCFLENSLCENIGRAVFKDCVLLKNITIPASVEGIGDSLLYGCENLEWIEIEKDSKLKYLNNSMCYECSSLKKIMYEGSNIFSVGDNAFYNCTALTDISVALSNTFRYAFYNCTSLESVTLKTTKIIEEYAFYGCKSLKKVELPRTLTDISHHAFADSGLEGIKFYQGDYTWKMRHRNNDYGASTTLQNYEIYNETTMASILKNNVNYNFSCLFYY